MRFPCFGARCGAWGDGAADARRQLEAWHVRFSRFRPDSELSRFNAGAPVASATMARLLDAVREAGSATGGLVDGTLLHEIDAAGYRTDLGAPLPLAVALRLAPRRRPARPHPAARWRDPRAPIDSGGLAKGLFADLIADRLGGDFAVDCGGDLRFGGTRRALEVADPFGGPALHAFDVGDGAAATSGIGRRSWLDARGRPAHHLLDPATGAPAFTGVVQATALAPTALEAEWRAKAAVLSGPDAATAWLPHGGVVVLDDGSHIIVSSAR